MNTNVNELEYINNAINSVDFLTFKSTEFIS